LANFWQPPRRSWRWPPTQLEIIAARIGVDDEELRELLRGEILRRLRSEARRGQLDGRVDMRGKRIDT
jgi:hypothetical protein